MALKTIGTEDINDNKFTLFKELRSVTKGTPNTDFNNMEDLYKRTTYKNKTTLFEATDQKEVIDIFHTYKKLFSDFKYVHVNDTPRIVVLKMFDEVMIIGIENLQIVRNLL